MYTFKKPIDTVSMKRIRTVSTFDKIIVKHCLITKF
jgi:hypothetical protein